MESKFYEYSSHQLHRFGPSNVFGKIESSCCDYQAESYLALLEGYHPNEADSTFIESSSPESSNENFISFPGPVMPSALMETSSEDDSSCGAAEDLLHISGRSLTGGLNAMWNSPPVSEDIIPITRAPDIFSSSLQADTALSADITKSLLSFSNVIDPCILNLNCEIASAPKPQSSNNLETTAPPGQRRVHNAMERERRGNLRRCFDRLRCVLPQLRDSRAHSLQILHEAVAHIASLQAESQALEAAKLQLAQQNSSLTTRVTMLRDQLYSQRNSSSESSPISSDHF